MDWDEEVAQCPVCRIEVPVAGPGGVVQHLLADHPTAPLSEAITRKLAEFQRQEEKS